MKPMVFLDVDGVLNRIVSRSQAKRNDYFVHSVNTRYGRFRVALDFKDRKRLAELSKVADLAWGTTWELEANFHLSPLLHLPNLDYATTLSNEDSKVYGVARLAGDRPFAWIDDALGFLEKDFMMNLSQEALPVDTDPSTGLTDEHVDLISKWTKSLK